LEYDNGPGRAGGCMLNLNLPAFERTDLASNLAARGEIFRRVL